MIVKEVVIPLIDFVEAPYRRPTGQSGTVYLLPGAVVAVGDVGDDRCNVLLSSSPDWLEIGMSAMAFLVLIGGVARNVPPPEPTA